MPFDTSDAEAKDRLLTHALADMTPAMERAEKTIEQAIARRFGEQSDGESPWAPLAPRTLEDRARKGYAPGPILQRSGTLRDSMKSSHGRDFAESGPSEDVSYARYHVEGTGTMPARNYLALNNDEMDAIERLILDHIERAGG